MEEIGNTAYYYPPLARTLLLCNELETYSEHQLPISDDDRASFFTRTAASNYPGLGNFLLHEFDPRPVANHLAAITLQELIRRGIIRDLFPDVIEVLACSPIWNSPLSAEWRRALLRNYLYPARLVKQPTVAELREALTPGGTKVRSAIPLPVLHHALTLAFSPRLVVWTGNDEGGLHGYQTSGERSDQLT